MTLTTNPIDEAVRCVHIAGADWIAAIPFFNLGGPKRPLWVSKADTSSLLTNLPGRNSTVF